MEKNQQPGGDDITLDSIRTSIMNVSLFFLGSFKTIAGFLKRHFLIIAIFSLLAGGVGYLTSKLIPIQFTFRMIVRHTQLSKATYGAMLIQLESLIQTKSFSHLASQLQVSSNTAAQLTHIEGFSMNGGFLENDTSTNTDLPFVIEVSFLSDSAGDSLQKGMLRFFNENPFFKERKTVERQINEEQLLFVNNELSKLDSLKTAYNRFLGSAGKTAAFYNNAINPADIYKQSSDYEQQKNNLLKWMDQDTETIGLIQSFRSVQKYVSLSRKVLHIIKFMIAGFLIGILFAGCMEIDAVSKTVRRE